MKNHKCIESTTCKCSLLALEPADDCPIHGWPWPYRCEICGRFISYKECKRFRDLYDDNLWKYQSNGGGSILR